MMSYTWVHVLDLLLQTWRAKLGGDSGGAGNQQNTVPVSAALPNETERGLEAQVGTAMIVTQNSYVNHVHSSLTRVLSD